MKGNRCLLLPLLFGVLILLLLPTSTSGLKCVTCRGGGVAEPEAATGSGRSGPVIEPFEPDPEERKRVREAFQVDCNKYPEKAGELEINCDKLLGPDKAMCSWSEGGEGKRICVGLNPDMVDKCFDKICYCKTDLCNKPGGSGGGGSSVGSFGFLLLLGMSLLLLQ